MNFTRFTPDLRHRAFGERREGRPFQSPAQATAWIRVFL